MDEPELLEPSTQIAVSGPPEWAKPIIDKHHEENRLDGRYTVDGNAVFFQADGSDEKVEVGRKE